MQITITGRNLEITPAIREHVEKRLSKIKKYFHSIVDVHVVLMLQRFQHICDMTVNASGITLHAHDTTQDLYASVDSVVDKIEGQLKKYKEKIQNHRTKAGPTESSLHLHVDVLDGQELETDRRSPQVIYTKEFDLKPMSIEEARTQMDLFNQEFLVFLNSRLNRVNVLYRRRDGNYCLIDPKM